MRALALLACFVFCIAIDASGEGVDGAATELDPENDIRLPELEIPGDITSRVSELRTGFDAGVDRSDDLRAFVNEYYGPALAKSDVFLENVRTMINRGRIFGGEETDGYGDCVAIGTSDKACCSGVLIHPRVVLTAGHCVSGCSDPKCLECSSRVIVGGRTDAPSEVAAVVDRVVHPQYTACCSGGKNDLAILFLAASVTGATPRKIVRTEWVNANLSATIVGYGTTNSLGTEGFGVKRYAPVPIESIECKSSGDAKKRDCHRKEMIAGNPLVGVDSCLGDSGGPLYVEYNGDEYLLGTTSRGVPSKTRPCGDGGIYTRVDLHKEWIDSELAKRGMSL